jgi:hypothetical protein
MTTRVIVMKFDDSGRRWNMRKLIMLSPLVAVALILGIGIAQAQQTPITIFGTATPKVPSDSDTNAVTLGVKFKSTQAGTVSAIRFYRAFRAPSVGYTVKLFNTGHTLLAQAKTAKDTCAIPCWEQVSLASPITISANTLYIAAYYDANGRYAGDTGGLTNTVTSGPLSAPSSSSVGGNGVYTYSTGFPNQTYQDSNYYVDIVFVPSAPTLKMVFNPTAPSIPANTPSGTTVATVMASWSDGSPFTGSFNMTQPPYADDGHAFSLSCTACASANVIVNPGGPGVGGDGGTTQNITVQAVQ